MADLNIVGQSIAAKSCSSRLTNKQSDTLRAFIKILVEQEINDNVIIDRVKKGDKQAFNLLVSRYQYKILHLVSRYIKNQAEQEDVVQEVFIKSYRAIANFRGDSAFYTWLYRIAVNTAKNYLVAANRRPPGQDIDIDEMTYSRGSDKLTEYATPDVTMQNDELVESIRNAIAQLPDELREAITLRELEGMRYEDIAAVMNCPIGTVRSRIFRAREAIEKSIAPLVG